MDGLAYKSQLRWHAGFYFFVITIAALLFDQGASGFVSVPNWVYVVVGTCLAAVVIGSVNGWLSSRAEDKADAELASGTDRAGDLIDRGKRLGWVMTAIAVGAAAAAYVVFRTLV